MCTRALSPRGCGFLLLSLYVAFGVCSVGICYARSVNIGLHAAWPHTSVTAEATVWIAHHLGNSEVLPYLEVFSGKVTEKDIIDSSGNITLRQDLEHELVKSAYLDRYQSELAWDTLSWVLHARQYTPFVHLQYSLATETLDAFRRSSSAGKQWKGSPTIFAVRIDASSSSASLLLQPSHLGNCEDCPTLHAHSQDTLSIALTLPRDISLSESCNFEAPVPLVILYAYLPSSKLLSWIGELKSKLENCEEKVVLRFWDSARSDVNDKSFAHERPGLQGYIVKADLKSTEYKVLDDRVFSSQLFDDCPFGEEGCARVEEPSDRESSSDAEDGLSVDSLTYTGEQVLHYLKNEGKGELEQGLRVLKTFTEDSPSIVASKSFQETKAPSGKEGKQILKAIQTLRDSVGDHDQLFINGRHFDFDDLTLGTEKLLHCLSVTTVSDMLLKAAAGNAATDQVAHTSTAGDKRRLRVNLNMDESLGPALVWFNDLLRDSRYKKWKSLDIGNDTSVSAYHERVKGSKKSSQNGGPDFVNVRAHHLSLVVFVDPGDPDQFAYASIPETVVRSDMPIRVGLVLVPNGRVSSLIAASFHYFLREKGRRTCARFVQMIRQVLQYLGGGLQQVPLSEQIVEIAFKQIAAETSGMDSSPADILENDDEIKGILRSAEQFAHKHELFSKPAEEDSRIAEGVQNKLSLLGILNGVVLKDISADIISVAIDEQTRIARHWSVEGSAAALEFNDSTSDFERWVASDPNLIVVEGLSEDMRAGDRRLSRPQSSDGIVRLSATTVFALREEVRRLDYIKPNVEHKSDEGHSMNVWLAAARREGELFRTAVSSMEKLAKSELAQRTKSRFAVLDENSGLHAEVLRAAGSKASEAGVLVVINGRVLHVSHIKALNNLGVEIASEYSGILSNTASPELMLLRFMFAKEADTACEISARGVSQNSRHLEFKEVLEAIEAPELSPWILTNDKDALRQKHSALSIVAVLNPLSPRAFVATGVLSAIAEAYGYDSVAMSILYSPTVEQMKMHFDPPSTYTKFVIGSKNNFHHANGRRIPERARFESLPDEKVFTIAVEPPRAWFVSSFATNHDMDNVVLSNLPSDIHELNAEYELRNLIVEGSCIDENESPPQGLKLVLRNEAGMMVDTLVMANLGYFQLKVPTPGRWFLHLAAGPSDKIFSLKTMETFSGQMRTVYHADSTGRVPILVESLSGAGGILLRVNRKPGMEDKSVLDPDAGEEPKAAGVVARLKARFVELYNRSKAQLDSAAVSGRSASTSEKIHVFSVASGHLYERFLKIMMSSATKHASRPIKFWLLENYLSPSFKKFLPIFAKKLGCEVGMVTYKWPGWLRAQTEKQRIIWAYKILFLDVLFPLDVGRVIFVDSDQVLRGDLAELMDIDLKGAPYGYVPFCDSRKEVEGYRFWKQGFWKETLGSQKYRISALYVVDLNRFRETAAGDTLRFIYQSLSADPNSLSNLDQDLPNYASVSSMGGAQSVPIYDLPADWLWCESWCDDESKKTAKAIDLCNNPMTKEPKLESAKRIIAEWTEYDDAASELTERIYRDLVDGNKASQPSRNTSNCVAEGSCDSAAQAEDVMKEEL